VWAEKSNGGDIYVEVKTSNTFSQAMVQLISLNKQNKEDEFIIVCNFKRLYFFIDLLKSKELKFQNFINKTQIYNYDKKNNYDLFCRDVKYIMNKELWVDDNRII